MKLHLEQSDDIKDVEITIRCGPVIDKPLQALIDQIRLYSFSLTAQKDGRIYQLPPADIYYIESVDDRTFLYCDNTVYECGKRLYELEAQFSGTSFVRISKSVILNVDKLESVHPLLNGRFEVKLLNQEKLLVNRHYVAAFKNKFGL